MTVLVNISIKIYFKERDILGDKEGHFIMIKGQCFRRYNSSKCVCIQQLNFKKKQKQVKIKDEIEKSTIGVKDLKHFSLRN